MNQKFTENCFFAYQAFIHDLTGITIAADRIRMVEGRVQKRLKALHMSSYDDYLAHAKSNKSEQLKFIDVITTNKTYFFRTPRIWNYIEESFLPKWFANNPGKKFTAWSAAASSGEEAHSIGILCEEFRENNPGFRYQIIGTDISQAMVDLCEAGNYSTTATAAFKESNPDWFSKYMVPTGSGDFKVKDNIRSRLRFSQHNLFNVFNRSPAFDLVLVRNVLIYFDPTDQETVLKNINTRLKADGLLVIGESESLTHINCDYEKVAPYVYEPLNLTTLGTGA